MRIPCSCFSERESYLTLSLTLALAKHSYFCRFAANRRLGTGYAEERDRRDYKLWIAGWAEGRGLQERSCGGAARSLNTALFGNPGCELVAN